MNEPRRYRIHEVLGKGSFGLVYRAELLGAGGFSKPVALKVLRGSFDPSAEIEQRLRDEARLLGMLRHPNVVQVDGLARLPDGWAVVMEYIQGVDVGVLIRIGPLPPRAALEIACEVAGALHAAWALPSPLTGQALKLVHRDLKPGNLRITAHGEVKILDFGAARAETGTREANTSAWRFGTPRYMAPERHDGVEGPASDIYSLGIVLAQMLTGEKASDPPTNADRHHKFSADVVEGVSGRLLAELSSRNEASGDEIVQLIGEMIAYEPANRPTARQVQQRLRALIEQVSGTDLRSWAEGEIPRLLALQPPLARDERCGEVIEESRGDPTLAPPRPPPPPAPEPGPMDTMPMRPRWHMAARGVGLALLVVLIGVGALRALLGRWPWVVPQPQPLAAAAPAPDPTGPNPTAPDAAAPPTALAAAAPDPEDAPASISFDADPVEVTAAPSPAPSPSGGPRSSASHTAPRAAEPEPARSVEIPAPEAAPTSVVMAAEPAPEAPQPPAAPSASARYSVDSEVAEAWVQSGTKRYQPGALPPGTYTLTVRFTADQDPVPAGTFTVSGGEFARLSCSASMQRCRRTQ